MLSCSVVPEEDAPTLWEAIEAERGKSGTQSDSGDSSPVDVETVDLTDIGEWLEQHEMQHCKENILSEGIQTVDDLRAFVARKDDFE